MKGGSGAQHWALQTWVTSDSATVTLSLSKSVWANLSVSSPPEIPVECCRLSSCWTSNVQGGKDKGRHLFNTNKEHKSNKMMGRSMNSGIIRSFTKWDGLLATVIVIPIHGPDTEWGCEQEIVVTFLRWSRFGESLAANGSCQKAVERLPPALGPAETGSPCREGHCSWVSAKHSGKGA